MPQLMDLPTEILTKIVTHADTLHEKETGLDIFTVMHVNQKFCDVAIRVHLKVKEFERDEMLTKMSQHKRCYVNWKHHNKEREPYRCETTIAGCEDFTLLPSCPAGHLQHPSPYGHEVIECDGGWQAQLRARRQAHTQAEQQARVRAEQHVREIAEIKALLEKREQDQSLDQKIMRSYEVLARLTLLFGSGSFRID